MFKVGDRVSFRKWDKYERPVKRLGDGVVEKVEHGTQRSESGIMVTVRSKNGPIRLDANWLESMDD